MDQEIVDYRKIYVSGIQGRYVTNDNLSEFITTLPNEFVVDYIGMSVQNEAIKSITFGKGPKRILMWSQMHGNESTTTKAIIDLINYLKDSIDDAKKIAELCTLTIIPILNPDGARNYTRVNANDKDLNRDAQELSEPESRVLQKVYQDFKPLFCFNLHDQRTIFNVGRTPKPATVSFLAPAFDVDRNNSPSRSISMQLIVAMNETLQQLIPGQVGRYDDGFNPNCVGDAFQMQETPTLLVEAGHYPGDYQREKTRELVFSALLRGIHTIIDGSLSSYSIDQYFTIPENGKQYVDILIRNPKVLNDKFDKNEIVTVQYREVLKEGKVHFQPETLILNIPPNEIFGHKILNCHYEEDISWLKENDILKLLS